MSVFPTAVLRAGNEIVFRLCDAKGNRKTIREKFKPEIFLPAPEGTPVDVADALALRGEIDPRISTPLTKRVFDNIYDFGNYFRENMDVPGVKLYGSSDPVVQAFTKAFPGDIEPVFSHIRVFNLDIEVVSSYKNSEDEIVRGPFPEPYIEEEKYRVKPFDAELYAEKINKFYRWWSTEFPDSSIPVWTNMNAAYPITSLQLSDRHAGKSIVWALPLKIGRDKFVYDVEDDQIGGLTVDYREFRTEQDMLIDFVKYWAGRSPDCWTGWNIKKFDSPYLAERILKILGEDWLKSLSPIGRYRKRVEKPQKGMPYTTYDFEGCPALDYVELYRKHRLKERSSYSLDHIAHCELEEKKLDYSEYKDLNSMYFLNFEKWIRYGIKDIRLVDKLDTKLEFLNLTFMLAALYHCNYEDTLATVKPWSCLMYHYNYYHGHGGKRVPRIKRVVENDVAYDGAFVHDPVPGLYEDLLSEDLNSLYPHIEQQSNMGPETKVTSAERREILYELCEELGEFKCDFNRNRARIALIDAIRQEREIIEELIAFGPFKFKCLEKRGVSMTPNLQFFINDFMSCYSAITRLMYGKRKAIKGEMLTWEQKEADLKEKDPTSNEYMIAKMMVAAKNTGQMGVKILMNAGYGAIGNRWFKEYYDPDIARAITACGELTNKWVTKYLTEDLRNYADTPNFRYVVYGDTDSIYLCLTPIAKMNGWKELETIEYVEKVDQFERTMIQPWIKGHCEALKDTLGSYEQRMFWGREVICKHGGILQAKKRYALLVDNSEGVQYAHPKLKVTGLESKKSTTPEICVPWLEACYKKAILKDEMGIHKAVKEYREAYYAQPPENVSVASSVANVNKYRAGNTWEPVKKTPYQASSSLLHNRLVEEAGGNTPFIEDGSKIMLVNLTDNPWGRGYIAFQGFWPEELDYVRKYIDYPGLFDKSFIQPLQLLLDAVKMNTKPKVNVFGFFKKG